MSTLANIDLLSQSTEFYNLVLVDEKKTLHSIKDLLRKLIIKPCTQFS